MARMAPPKRLRGGVIVAGGHELHETYSDYWTKEVYGSCLQRDRN